MFQEWDFWLNDYKDSAGFKTFMRGMTHLYKNIDQDFLMIKQPLRLPGTVMNSDNWEYRPCYSKRYCIGKFKENSLTF
jgi:hypothetical protein